MHKFIAAFGAALVTLGAFGATAAEPSTQSTPSLESVVGFCKASYGAFKDGRDLTTYKDAVAKLSDDNKKFVGAICLVYGVGFEDGTKWKGNLS